MEAASDRGSYPTVERGSSLGSELSPWRYASKAKLPPVRDAAVRTSPTLGDRLYHIIPNVSLKPKIPHDSLISVKSQAV